MKYPKIVDTGHFNSGKTELIRTVSEIPIVTTETRRTDGRIGEKATTTVVMVDSTNPNGITETEKIISYFKEISDLPYLIVANKQDLANAVPPEEMKEALGLTDEDRVVPCVATNPFQASVVIRAILEEII